MADFKRSAKSRHSELSLLFKPNDETSRQGTNSSSTGKNQRRTVDRWGRKRVFYIGVVLFGIAAFGAGFSSTIGELVFFRGLQSLGAATAFIASAALLTDVFPKKDRVYAISIYGGVTGLGLVIGPFLGGILIGLLDWRWVFWINLPLIVAGLAACSFSLKDIPQEQHSTKIDWWGLALLIIGLGTLMYGIIASAEANWSSFSGWMFLGVGASSIIFLVILDSRRQEPLLDLHIFKNNLVTLATLSCALAGVVSTVFMFFDPLYLRILRELSPFLIGLLIAIIPAAQVVISFVFSHSVKRFGIRNLLFFSIFSAVCAAGLHRFIDAQTPLLFLVLPFFLLGINWGLSNAGVITAVNQVIPPKHIASALGTITTVWNFTGSMILAVSTAIFHSAAKTGSFLSGFHSAITFIILFATLILAAAILNQYKRTKKA
jgi:MFS family permease